MRGSVLPGLLSPKAPCKNNSSQVIPKWRVILTIDSRVFYLQIPNVKVEFDFISLVINMHVQSE
jgi:hypothetical protein